jgi:hypothetical protein
LKKSIKTPWVQAEGQASPTEKGMERESWVHKLSNNNFKHQLDIQCSTQANFETIFKWISIVKLSKMACNLKIVEPLEIISKYISKRYVSLGISLVAFIVILV